ncbi:hypothetical protein HZF08_32935 [Paenibacillus sp. CGMCC 1.16610]|uniref:Dockerin domain-containing protein n=1 Tax=Paenibacillus anseongense TaxID=2682845 RepID=A0ABW9U296_9BACL|nr:MULTISPECIES: cohesin domain-containing protein [Paenibacillus]MBA2943075.1 hypothetical protein [Paenibacillus sp. CGMCC 1.16610]MVQ33571.1 hypothetical protein [Paenibacillus anseongense]
MNRRMLKSVGVLVITALFVSNYSFPFNGNKAYAANEGDWPEISGFLQNLVGVYTAPSYDTDSFTPNGPIMGNGDMQVVLVGDVNKQVFSISESDMWTDGGGNNEMWSDGGGGVRVITTGGVTIRPTTVPASPTAAFRQEQHLLDAKVNATSQANFKTSTYVSANENAMITELWTDGTSPIPMSVDVWTKADTPSFPSLSGIDAANGTLWATRESNSDATAQFTFSGTSVKWIGAKNGNGGIADVYIDGVLDQAGIDTYAASKQYQQVLYSKSGLTPGTHTIKVVVTGTKNPSSGDTVLVVDAFEYTSLTGSSITVDDKDTAIVYSPHWSDYSDGGDYSGTEKYANSKAVKWTSRNALATRVIGATASLTTDDKGKSTASFTLNPATTVKIYTVLKGGKNATNHLSDAKSRVSQMDDVTVTNLKTAHVEWWKQFWLKSYVRTYDDTLDKFYYGALYQFGATNRAEFTPVGQYPFCLTDDPGWLGDYHMNQEYMGQNAGFFSGNRSELSDGVFQPLLDFMETGRTYAQTKMQQVHPSFSPAQGILYPVGIAPWGIDSSEEWFGHQVMDASYTGALVVWNYYYNQDLEWLRTQGYPFIKALGDFWISHIGAKVNGKYVTYGAAYEEAFGRNPGLDIGLIKFVMKALLTTSQDLGVDANMRPTWQDIYDNISDYPTAVQNGKTVFVSVEGATSYKFYPDLELIWPAENLSISSSKNLKDIAFNTLDIAQFDVPKYSIFANRVGYPIDTAITKLKNNFINKPVATFEGLRQNFTIGGLHYNGEYLEFINSAMLQSQEGFIRIFPNWYNNKAAKFKRLKAMGAFLVDGEMTSAGIIQNVKMVSEKGKTASVLNPWPGQNLRVTQNGNPVPTSVNGDVYTFSTSAGSSYELSPELANNGNPVSSISIATVDNVSTITTKSGILQLSATVLPANATNKNVAWVAFETDGTTVTDRATVDANGVLTAVKDGIAKVVASATDGSGIQAFRYIIISGQTSLPTDVPQATLTGPAVVQAGAAFSTQFGLNNVTASVTSAVYAADITISFDADTIDFVSVDPLISGFPVVQTKTEVPGQVRIIAVKEGDTGVITASGDVFKFNWIAKPNHPSTTTTNLMLTKVAVSNGLGQKIDAVPANLAVSVTATADKTTLQTIISLAQSIYDRSVEGTQAGQYTVGSRATLLSAIQAASAIDSDPAATQQQLDQAAMTLNQALQAFSGQIITVYKRGDVNGDNAIDIGDLGKAAVHYGKTSASSDWNVAKSADINQDGKINIVDIVGIAKLILQ